jgi:hypothetical protein
VTARCPSDLALEAHLLDPAGSKVADHVATCARCGERLARMRAEGEEFARSVFPATVEAVEAAAARPPWWRRSLVLLPLPALAAAAAVLLLVRPAAPPDDYLGSKGSAPHPTLSIFAATGAGVAQLLDGQPVAATASIRFRVRSPPGCHLWVVSVDGAGGVSRLYPASGEAARPAPGESELPGGAVLDGRAGPERVYAICGRTPLPWPAVEASLHPVAPSEEAIRHKSPPRGLPLGTTWSSVLLEKRP